MIRHNARVRLLGCAMLLSACSLLDPERHFAAALESNRAAWTRLAIHNYQITVQQSCFCPPEESGPLIVTVRVDTVVTVVDKATGVAFRRNPSFSVNAMFDVIDNAIRNDYDGTVFMYDARYHYPVRLTFYIRNAADSGETITAGDLIPQ